MNHWFSWIKISDFWHFSFSQSTGIIPFSRCFNLPIAESRAFVDRKGFPDLHSVHCIAVIIPHQQNERETTAYISLSNRIHFHNRIHHRHYLIFNTKPVSSTNFICLLDFCVNMNHSRIHTGTITRQTQ